MAKRVSVSKLNASTIDILNVIRTNASAEYQSMVPTVSKATDIPKVGEVLFGYPALANQFISALVNRIAAVRIKSATFNNLYRDLKKGYLEFGETVEEVFVQIARVREFTALKGEERELKRTLPDVKSAFHAVNWRVQYPITVEAEQLRQAFLSQDGVQDLIARIVDAVYTAAEYDEYLLFKYLLIKQIAKGRLHAVGVDTTDIKNSAVAFRGTSNQLTFLSNTYNPAKVHTSTPKENQYIFMTSDFNARYDVEVLAAAFNMDKADFNGHLKLIDSFSTFDNDRWNEIRRNSDMVEEVTAVELAAMANVQAVLVDEQFFQIYDNLDMMTEKIVASGLYWNYFYNVWKTVSVSPFSNAVVFLNNDSVPSVPDEIEFKVESVEKSETATVFTLIYDGTGTARLIQTEELTKAGIAVHPYGAVIVPANYTGTSVPLEAVWNDNDYLFSGSVSMSEAVGSNITLS